MSAKPADFFIGLVDFFAILMPGILSTYLVMDKGKNIFGTTLPALQSDIAKWLAFIVIAYIVGHLLHHVGAVLDKWIYDKLYVKWKRRNGEEKLLVKTRAIMKEMLGEDFDMTSAFSWAGSYVRARSATVAQELERGGADSKFFRSLAIVAFIALFVLGNEAFYIAVLILVFSVLRYCNRRWANSQLTYEYFILFSKIL